MPHARTPLHIAYLISLCLLPFLIVEDEGVCTYTPSHTHLTQHNLARREDLLPTGSEEKSGGWKNDKGEGIIPHLPAVDDQQID